MTIQAIPSATEVTTQAICPTAEVTTQAIRSAAQVTTQAFLSKVKVVTQVILSAAKEVTQIILSAAEVVTRAVLSAAEVVTRAVLWTRLTLADQQVARAGRFLVGVTVLALLQRDIIEISFKVPANRVTHIRTKYNTRASNTKKISQISNYQRRPSINIYI